MKATIEVSRTGEAFHVTVREGASATQHVVRASADALQSLAPGVAPERAIEAAFRFLLDREPKEAILASFAIGVISRYFPEFEAELARYLPAR